MSAQRIGVPSDASPQVRQAFRRLLGSSQSFDTSATTPAYTLLASGSATAANNNQVLAAVIEELIDKGVLDGTK